MVLFLHPLECPKRSSRPRFDRVDGVHGVYMRVTACRFCGVPTDVPHETQALCIAALQDEIGRMRDMVIRVKRPAREPELCKKDPVAPGPRDRNT